MRLPSLKTFCIFLAAVFPFHGSDAEGSYSLCRNVSSTVSPLVVCEDFAAGNNVAVNAQTLELLDERNGTLQDLIDCLDTGGSVIFDLAEIMVPETIAIRRNVRFLSTPGARTRLMCDNQTILDIRYISKTARSTDFVIL